MLLKLCVIALALSPALLLAQDAPPEEVAAPVAAKEDVESIDAIYPYEWRLTDEMTQPAQQSGVNSMQLFFDD